jgi:signal transduction histidine kinase
MPADQRADPLAELPAERPAELLPALAGLLDSLPDAVLVVDADGRVVAANGPAAQAWARPAAPGAALPAAGGGLPGRPLRELVGVDAEALVALAGSQTQMQTPPHVARADGSRWAIELSVGSWQHGARQLRTFQFRDIEATRGVERMKDEFLATVSHELRTPITALLGALGLMVSGAAGALPSAMQPLADAAQRNGQRLGQLIDDVLDLTRLEGDRLNLRPLLMPLDQLLREALDANQRDAQRAQVSLALQIDPELEGVELRLDPHRFLQVMAKLLSNAIKHSPPFAAVGIELRRRGAQAQVQVRDRGPGIDPAFRAHLFEKFSQADPSDRRVVGGTGLGLYISRLLVERMGGHIAAEAPSDGGAVFVVSLPLPHRPGRGFAVSLAGAVRDALTRGSGALP